MTVRVRNVEDRPIEQPSIAPFIDITFQLLVFFMLTIKFKQEEGHLLSLLPHRGFGSGQAEWIEEVRVYVCADGVTHRFDQHIGVKESHQQVVAGLKQQDPKVGEICSAWVELNYRKETWPLYRTDRYPGKSSENKRTYARLASEVQALHARASAAQGGQKVRVVIDCDGLVPWEHAFGLLNAFQRIHIHDIEWAGNPRFDRYFGSAGR